MRPHDRRELEGKKKGAVGDARAILLAATPPGERSEIAARYDHSIEAAELDTDRQPTAAELEQERMSLWRSTVAVELAEHGGYRDIAMRYMGGHRTSAGMDRAIGEAEASTPFPPDAEVLAAWLEGRRSRRVYIRQRYGV